MNQFGIFGRNWKENSLGILEEIEWERIYEMDKD